MLIKLLSESIIFGCCVRGCGSTFGRNLPAAQAKQVNIIGPNRGFDTSIEDPATPNDAASVVAATNANVRPRNARCL